MTSWNWRVVFQDPRTDEVTTFTGRIQLETDDEEVVCDEVEEHLRLLYDISFKSSLLEITVWPAS
jgi:hypothetical protein